MVKPEVSIGNEYRHPPQNRPGTPQLGAGFGLSRATSYRYHDEVLAVLSAQAPDLTDALRRVEAEGWSHVVLDGKVVDSDRCAQKTTSRKGEAIDAWYSGKTRDFGGNIQAVMRPDGSPIWVSEVEPGSVHDLLVAREQALGPLYAAAARGPPTLADSGYEGAGHGMFTPFKKPSDGRELHVSNRTYNKLLRSMRCIGERGFALLTQRWRAARRHDHTEEDRRYRQERAGPHPVRAWIPIMLR